MNARIFSLLFFIAFVFNESFGQTANPQSYKYNFTVAKDGTGDYLFIQDAIDAMRVYPLAPIKLYIKNGIYQEKIELPTNNVDVTFIGESVDGVIITWNDYSGKGKHTTFTSYTAKISGNRFKAENITFKNSAGPVGQALALYVDADRAVFINCKFLGHQDTIYVAGESSNQYFENCYIEGTTDFIFGPGTAVFQNCTIKAKSNSFITAASTPKNKEHGFIFKSCKVISDSAVSKVFLGRPWRSHAKTVFIDTDLPATIAPEGWDTWSNPANEKSVFYAEYNNRGPGATLNNRAKWASQLTSKQAKKYTLMSIFNIPPAEKDQPWYNSKAEQFDPSLFQNHTIEVLPLYDVVPNNIATKDKEEITITDIKRIAKVTHPSVTVYHPAKPNGKAVVICPGGGYWILAIDKEGMKVAEEFTRWGITAVVLKYRIPDTEHQLDKSLAPLQDAQAALQLVRKNASAWKVNPSKVGIMGFSAGGHLASSASVHHDFSANKESTDTTSKRPDFSILIYPVISSDTSISHRGSITKLTNGLPNEKEQIAFFSNENYVNTSTPPVFLVHASDDLAVPVANSIKYYEACIRNKVPADMHIYAKGGHGFGLHNKTTDDSWMERLQNWMSGL
jgi:pectinesterase